MNKKVKDALIPIVEKLTPIARIAERVAHVAVHVQKPTLISMTGLAASGLAGLAEQLGNSKTPGWNVRPFLSKGQAFSAVEEAGAKIVVRKYEDSFERIDCQVHGTRFVIYNDGSIGSSGAFAPAFLEWLRQAFDRTLAAAIEIIQHPGERGNGPNYEARPVQLAPYEAPQAAKILADTMPLLEGGRCILLDGKPGVGKTTMAEIVARDAKLGRVVKLDGGIIGGVRMGDSGMASTTHVPTSSNLRESLRLLSPGVIIVDDIDKVYMPLSTIEALRGATKLVILTANNGEFDDVLDGAMTRAGRVDEVFSIEPTVVRREPPFDLLDDKDWAEVSQWPIAYLLEVKKRLLYRPGRDLRLDDLRARLAKKTRSGDVLR